MFNYSINYLITQSVRIVDIIKIKPHMSAENSTVHESFELTLHEKCYYQLLLIRIGVRCRLGIN